MRRIRSSYLHQCGARRAIARANSSETRMPTKVWPHTYGAAVRALNQSECKAFGRPAVAVAVGGHT